MIGGAGCLSNLFKFFPNFFLVPVLLILLLLLLLLLVPLLFSGKEDVVDVMDGFNELMDGTSSNITNNSQTYDRLLPTNRESDVSAVGQH